ncbi:ABC transporter ATP-binding protein [Castellaniella caeni]|uniref:ABC transporter ATP-binding protein n=1 Tax=Castellaniella caeni TaxID=266123 RepID=UPI000C9ECB57|nr:ABC transporter ATP-binding protein [Castellaniella caeni]
MTQPFLSIRNLRKDFGSFTAIHDVTLDIAQGEFMTFLGPSGSGKSTTLYILAGFQEPTEGDILLDGKSLLSTPPHQRNIGMVFQRYTLFPHLSVAENVAFPLRVRRCAKSEIDDRVQAALKLVHLEDLAQRMPSLMSGGQQQRVAIARALVYNPPVLLMDEPLSALDKKLREEIQLEIRRIHQETGVTILYVTHDQEEALRLSDRISVFSQGRIEQTGTGQSLYAQPATRFVAGFIGDSNFLEARVLAQHGQTARLSVCGDIVLDDIPVQGKAGAGQATLLLRPERLSLQQTPGERCLPVTVRDMTFLGNTVEVSTQTDQGEDLSVRLPFGAPIITHLTQGERVWASFETHAVHAFL